MTNEPNNWSEIVEKLRRLMGLAPPTPEQADAEMRSAGEIPMSDEEIRAIAKAATEGRRDRPELETNYEWLSEQHDETVEDSLLVMNRNKGDDDEEVQKRLEELRREALDSDEDDDPEDEQV